MTVVAIFVVPFSLNIKTDNGKHLAISIETKTTKAQTVPGGGVGQYNGPDKQWSAAPAPVAATSNSFGCNLDPSTWFSNCIGLFLYEIIWKTSAEFTRLAAHILDFFVYYSTNSDSYASPFVTKAWGAVRDIANIFFIIALLYVAIKTILGLNVTNNKKLVGTVIIVALIINFSLFTTKVVIDASNILAKVFYNNISSQQKNEDGTTSATGSGSGGEKSISIGLVKQFDPVSILKNSDVAINMGQTIFVTLLSIAMMGFMIYIFLSVALLFVARVVSLWISMIFSPLAFASYTIPFDIPGFGHKEWWKTLFENAFLAPLFIFFLYIIILFGDFLSLIKYNTQNADFIQIAMKTIIPFAIIFILLQKAKKLAVQYSGEMGKAIMTGAKMVGGLALGAVTGGAALAGRASIGRLGALTANSGALKAAEAAGGLRGFGAKQLRNLGKFTGSGSFDARGIKIAGKDLASTGLKVNTFGKQNEGGFVKRRTDQVEKKQKRAKELEVGEDEGLKQNIRQAETGLHEIKNGDIVNATGATVRRQDEIVRLNNGGTHAEGVTAQADQTAARAAQIANPANPALIVAREAATNTELATRGLGGLERNVTAAERAVTAAERAVKDAVDNLATANATGTATQQTAATDTLRIAREDRDAQINGGKLSNGQRVDLGNSLTGAREALETRQAAIRGIEGPIKEAENILKLAENAVTSENRVRRENFARSNLTPASQTISFIMSGGQHSFSGEREASNKIRADIKEEKK